MWDNFSLVSAAHFFYCNGREDDLQDDLGEGVPRCESCPLLASISSVEFEVPSSTETVCKV